MGGVGKNLTVFVPARESVLRHWAANKFNILTTGVPLINGPGPKPSGRLQIAIYRQLIPVAPISPSQNLAVMVPGTYYDSGTLTTLQQFSSVSFADTLQLGGSYWIVVRFSDLTASGINVYQFNYNGWTLVDVNLYASIMTDTTSTGALPATYLTTNIVPCPNNYPYVRADFS